MSIDYSRQFKTITAAEVDEMTSAWDRTSVYAEARRAFTSAQRREARGISVAFAECDGYFYVWAGQSSPYNATYTVDVDGTLHITHNACGITQTAKPVRVFDDGTASFGSDANYCRHCESSGRPAGLNY